MSNLTRETGGGQRPPQVWWSPEWGLIWLDQWSSMYRRLDGGRAVGFFHLPAHAARLTGLQDDPACYCCGEAPVLCQACADMVLEDASA